MNNSMPLFNIKEFISFHRPDDCSIMICMTPFEGGEAKRIVMDGVVLCYKCETEEETRKHAKRVVDYLYNNAMRFINSNIGEKPKFIFENIDNRFQPKQKDKKDAIERH